MSGAVANVTVLLAAGAIARLFDENAVGIPDAAALPCSYTSAS